jgi:hypothetical protein
MGAQGPEKLLRRIDRSLDARIGFYPLSLRQSLRHGFNRERMRPGHQNWFLDPSRAGSLPGWHVLDRAMTSWHYGRLRYVPGPLLERLRREHADCAAIRRCSPSSVVVGAPYRAAGGRSHRGWDYTVGKESLP